MRARRLWAIAALAATFAAVILAVLAAVEHFPSGLSVLACLLAALAAAFYGVQRRGVKRTAGLVAALVLAAGAIALVIIEASLLEDVLIVAVAVAALTAARQAFAPHVKLPSLPAPSHPVLIYNPLSGDGKAKRFGLASQARSRGIEPVELRRGDDLEQLARDAVARGADGLAMAGGDGSQAIVAEVAAELGLPYACIPSGTRNHFALDLGVDRNDVVGALDAFVNGGERTVDLAEVNGRVFVNNVSLGLYAEAVQRPEYRGAKLHTLLETVPDSVGPDADPASLSWTGRDGARACVAALVSNNPYRLGPVLGAGTRPRLDRGLLGIAAVTPAGTPRNGRGGGPPAVRQWSEPEFELQAAGPVPAGIDGEARQLEPPLRFRVRPRALRVRIAPHHPGASPSAFEPDSPWEMIKALARLILRGTSPAQD